MLSVARRPKSTAGAGAGTTCDGTEPGRGAPETVRRDAHRNDSGIAGPRRARGVAGAAPPRRYYAAAPGVYSILPSVYLYFSRTRLDVIHARVYFRCSHLGTARAFTKIYSDD
mgnify:CR=1 FL=1